MAAETHAPALSLAEFASKASESRGWRGMLSVLGVFCLPCVPGFGRWLKPVQTPERYADGLTIILPGVDGESFLSHSIAWGLMDAGCPGAIEIDDWTTGNMLAALYHLRSTKRHHREAQRIADRISAYQKEHPGKPVNLVGHSAGGAMALLILEKLPAGATVNSAVLLAPAISPEYSLTQHLPRVDQGIWNFSSHYDWLFLRVLTRVFGTVDGRYLHSAGASGFNRPADLCENGRQLYDSKLNELPFRRDMVQSFNLGGHFGCTNRVFVSEWVAPLLQQVPQATPAAGPQEPRPEDAGLVGVAVLPA